MPATSNPYHIGPAYAGREQHRIQLSAVLDKSDQDAVLLLDLLARHKRLPVCFLADLFKAVHQEPHALLTVEGIMDVLFSSCLVRQLFG